MSPAEIAVWRQLEPFGQRGAPVGHPSPPLLRLERLGQAERVRIGSRTRWRVRPHELEGGDLCIDGPDGCCTLCRASLDPCGACGGRAYHRAACPAERDGDPVATEEVG